MVSKALAHSEDARDVPGEELDRLFARVERRPFAQEAGPSLDPSQDIGERSDIPQDGVGPGQDIAFTPDVVGLLRAGMRNGDWNDLPPDGIGTTIDDVDNKLPGWSFNQETGTGGVATIETDSEGAAGREIRFDFGSDPEANDYMYVEQVVPTTSLIKFMSIAANHEGSIKCSLVIETEFFDVDGVSTDGSVSKDLVDATTGAEFSRIWRTPDAAQKQRLRVRIGARVTTDWSSGSEVRNIRHVWTTSPETHTVNIRGERNNLDPVASLTFDMWLGAGSNNELDWTAYLPGFVIGSSCQISTVTDEGSVTFEVQISGVGRRGPAPDLDGTTGNFRAASYALLDGATAYDFEIGDGLRPVFTTDADYVASAKDWAADHLLLLVAHDTNAWDQLL